MKIKNLMDLIGFVGQDRAARHGADGVAVPRLSLETTERWTDKYGEAKEHTECQQAVCFESSPNRSGNSSRKGASIEVEGSLRSNARRYRFDHLASCRAAAAVSFLVLAAARNAFASSAGMPWEGPLQQLVQSLTGPVAKAIGIGAIVIAALGMAISEGGHTMKTFLRILLALSIAFTAGTFGLQFIGFSGGLAV